MSSCISQIRSTGNRQYGSHSLYWGKMRIQEDASRKHHLLVCHSLDVAAICLCLLNAHHSLLRNLSALLGLTETRTEELSCFLLALHDIGKFAESFQGRDADIFTKLRGRAPQRFGGPRHDILSHVLWREIVLRKIAPSFSAPLNEDIDLLNDMLQHLYGPVAGHHGKPADAYTPLCLDEYLCADDKHALESFVSDLLHMFIEPHAPIALSFSSGTNLPAVSWVLAGLAVLCDWIGSDEHFFPFVDNPVPLDVYWKEYALPQARTALAASGVLPVHVAQHTGMSFLFPTIASPSPLQTHAASCSLGTAPQLFVIEETTGAGKTEAALVLAHRLMANGLADGIYLALPTMATANAMYDRLADSYGRLFDSVTKPSLVLAHSARSISDRFTGSVATIVGRSNEPSGEVEAGAQCAAWIADNRKKAFLAHVGVGTIDQALVAVLPAYHQSLRLLGLHRKVLVVDEVHACDPYMHMLLQSLLQFHAGLGGSAVLLSASLPQNMRAELAAAFARGIGCATPGLAECSYPLITHVSRAATTEMPFETRGDLHRTIAVRMVHDKTTIVNFIREMLAQGRCVCWIRNTVLDALHAFDTFSPSVSPDRLTLFHARFAMGDRIATEERVKNRFGRDSTDAVRSGQLVIATQVVEQSLDLDFDEIVSDLAPMDRIIQRAGRLHRHARCRQDATSMPTLTVFSPESSADVDAAWYSSVFPHAAHVYPLHGLLWRTAHILSEMKQWSQPDDIRTMIEAAFNCDDSTPPILRKQDDKELGRIKADQSVAQFNALRFEAGYCGGAIWADDIYAPTRLGEKSVTVRLAQWDGRNLGPWSDHPRHPWPMSDLSVRVALIGAEAPMWEPLASAVAAAKDAMPGKGEHCVLVPLEHTNGIWRGQAVSCNGNAVLVQYSRQRGLTVSKGDADALQSD